MQIRFRKCREYGLRSTEVYEWSPDGQRWYPVHRSNVQFTENMLAEDIRSVFNAALQGEALLVANYIRKDGYKRLVVTGIKSPGADSSEQPAAKIKRAYERLQREGFFGEEKI